MINLIEQNKEWIFSGVGISVISSFFSAITFVFTWLIKNRIEKKKRKRLQIESITNKLEIPNIEKHQNNDLLNIAYKQKTYKNLCYYSVNLNNTGEKVIENQNLLFCFPDDTIIVENVHKTSNSLINIETNETQNKNEIHVIINRLETNDNVLFSFLINTNEPEKIKYIPRGVDSIDYIKDKTNNMNDISKLINIVVIFIFLDFVPYISTLLKAILILVSSPIWVRIISTLLDKGYNINNSVYLHEKFSLHDNSKLNINQNIEDKD